MLAVRTRRSSSRRKRAFNRTDIMDVSSHSLQRMRRRVCVDGVPKQPASPVVQSSTCSSRGFAEKPLESTVFFRGSRIAYHQRSKIAASSGRHRRPVDDIRPRASQLHVGLESVRPVSFGERCARRFRMLENILVKTGAWFSLSPQYALRASLVGAIFLGAMLTALLYRYFGEQALAQGESPKAAKVALERSQASMPEEPAVLGANDHALDDQFVTEVTEDLESIREVEEKKELETKIREMVAGYPIEDMVPYILEKDKIVAAFLIGIAKKESAWGKRVPLLKSHDCFNYWGYRGKRRFMGTGGHTCFNSPKDAVDTVSRRLEKLIYTEKVDTPAEMMVVWKCGYDCSSHDKADTKKWIQDVDLYFHDIDE